MIYVAAKRKRAHCRQGFAVERGKRRPQQIVGTAVGQCDAVVRAPLQKVAEILDPGTGFEHCAVLTEQQRGQSHRGERLLGAPGAL